jgi:tetratricopeptide (TPR) repeat protein
VSPDHPTTRIENDIFNNTFPSSPLQVNFKDAESDYSDAIAADSAFAPAYFLRATVVYRMGRYEEAIKDFEVANKLEPFNKEFRKERNIESAGWKFC